MKNKKQLLYSDAVVLQGIQNQLDELFNYCIDEGLSCLVTADTAQNYSLMFMVSVANRERYWFIDEADYQMYLTYFDICEENGEKQFYKSLLEFNSKVMSKDGVNRWIRNMMPKTEPKEDEWPTNGTAFDELLNEHLQNDVFG